jgi:hypothetical protein
MSARGSVAAAFRSSVKGDLEPPWHPDQPLAVIDGLADRGPSRRGDT